MSDFLEDKKQLTGLLDSIAADGVANNVSISALIDTEDPAFPFDYRWIQKAGASSRAGGLCVERLFDTGFMDFGFREVRNEDNLEGVVYKDIEDMFSDPDCIGVATQAYFGPQGDSIRMARGIEAEAEEEDPDTYKFALFLTGVQQNIVDGEPAQQLDYEDVSKVLGLIFKFELGGRVLVAFQRTQRMWIQQKSSYLLFSRDDTPEFFSDRSLKLGSSFDFCIFGENVYFKSLKTLEGLFAFRKLMQQHARDYADTLDHLVADYEKLEERITESTTVANKLLKIQKDGSAVVDMPANEVAYRVKRLAYYSGKVNFNEEDKVMLVTNANVSNFLKMLGDDMLVSPLTEAHYEAKSKKRLDDPNE